MIHPSGWPLIDPDSKDSSSSSGARERTFTVYISGLNIFILFILGCSGRSRAERLPFSSKQRLLDLQDQPANQAPRQIRRARPSLRLKVPCHQTAKGPSRHMRKSTFILTLPLPLSCFLPYAADRISYLRNPQAIRDVCRDRRGSSTSRTRGAARSASWASARRILTRRAEPDRGGGAASGLCNGLGDCNGLVDWIGSATVACSATISGSATVLLQGARARGLGGRQAHGRRGAIYVDLMERTREIRHVCRARENT